jgi:stage V sporulation protein SpoVS
MEMTATDGAAALAATLRREGSAELQFAGCRTALKAVKALALANMFLNQHASALSFTSTAVRPVFAHAHRHFAGDGAGVEGQQQQQHQGQSAGGRAGASSGAQQWGPMGGPQEPPAPPPPAYDYLLSLWSRPMDPG